VVEVDKFASKIAGHSYYHGDKILARLYCLKEGQEIEESIEPADVVEVVHGEWIDKPTGRYCHIGSYCSVCGKKSGIAGIESNRHKPYCPNCGAKMDGKGDKR
jgi:tRNA(Ile2) C34 agmatinyltransferase TiaS